jgi:hypothetical protein
MPIMVTYPVTYHSILVQREATRELQELTSRVKAQAGYSSLCTTGPTRLEPLLRNESRLAYIRACISSGGDKKSLKVFMNDGVVWIWLKFYTVHPAR